jgi:chromosome segregation ATPase
LDDTLLLQHEIALVCNKHNISIQQLGSNLAFENAIIRRGFDGNKIHSVLSAIERIFVQDGSLKPDDVAKLISEIFEVVLKNQVPLRNLPHKIKGEYDELKKLEDQINSIKKSITELKNKKNSAIAEYNSSIKELHKFSDLRDHFEKLGVEFDDIDGIENVLRNIEEMDDNPKGLITELSKIRVLRLTISEIESQCEDNEDNLRILKKAYKNIETKWNFLFPAVEEVRKLLQKGINPVDISNIFDIVSKHQGYLSLKELGEYIDTYGGIVGAISKKKREWKKGHVDGQILDAPAPF